MAESLSVTSGDARGTSIPIEGEFVIGRSTPALPGLQADTEISRVHARVWLSDDGEPMIEDLGSRNGTFLNGSRIHGPRVLHLGDWLRTGRTTMEVVGNGKPGEAPRYDALVEEEETAGHPVAAAVGSPGHIRPWPLAAILAALLAGGGIGAAVAASRDDSAKTSTMVVTRRVERPVPPPRLVAPARPVQLPAYSAAASRDAFVHAFCGRGATAPKGVCGCTYVELTRREPYALLLAQVARSHGRRIAPAIVSASRACGAG